jgi:hypothetical protein
MKMRWLVEASNLAQPGAFRLKALSNFLIVTAIDLHEIRRHYLPPAYVAF